MSYFWEAEIGQAEYQGSPPRTISGGASRVGPVSPIERDEWVARFFEILAAGYAAQPLPPSRAPGKRTGRHKHSKAKNLLDALLTRADQVLAIRRSSRMAKVQQKIVGTFRSATGATAFCRIRSYLAPMQKQGHPLLSALAAVFHGHPFPVAWAPE